MKLLSSSLLLLIRLTRINSLTINLDKTDAARWEERQIKQIPKPVLGAFADHLHTIASLFSSLIGTGAYQSTTDSDAIDCEHTTLGHGPYCLISEAQGQSASGNSTKCYQEFGCEFYDTGINFGNNARLCCFKGYENKQFESAFIDQIDFSHPVRLFQANQNNVGKIYDVGGHDFKVVAGHFGIAEMIFTPQPKPDTVSTIVENTWNGCPFADTVGYHSIDILPEDHEEYISRELTASFVGDAFRLCTVEGNGTKSEVSNEDVRTLMPYCTFKLAGQDCPNEAPLAMRFDDIVAGHRLPDDNLYSAITYLDSSAFCCAKSDHDTHERTLINMEYLKSGDSEESTDVYEFFKSKYQVLKWPHADCAEFVYPKFDLTENKVKLTDKRTYPWHHSDLELTFCTYTKPQTWDDIWNPTPSSELDDELNEIEVDENQGMISMPCDGPDCDGPVIQKLQPTEEAQEVHEDATTKPTLPTAEEVKNEVTQKNTIAGNFPAIVTVNNHFPEYLDSQQGEDDEEDDNNTIIDDMGNSIDLDYPNPTSDTIIQHGW